MKNYILFLMLSLSFSFSYAADEELFGINNMGKNFVFTVPPCIESASPYENMVLLYVSSPYRTWVNINLEANNIHFSRQLLPNQTEVIELPANQVIPYSKGIIDIEIDPKVFKEYAISINAEKPISIIASVRYNQSSDAFTVFPVETLGTGYILSSYNDASEFYPSISSLSSIAGIVAPYDNTRIEMIIGGNDETLVAGFNKSGDTLRALLNAGDVYMVPTLSNRSDLSGSYIKATKPIAVISGNQNTNIPLETGNSDYLANMELPFEAWGNEYLVPHFSERRYSPVIRIYAKDENTNIYINGEWVTTLHGGGGKINEAFIETRVHDGEEKSAAYIRADKPIAVTMYNTGVKEDGLPEKIGGPSLVSLSSIRQFQKHILVPMPENYKQYTYDSYRVSIIVSEHQSTDELLIGRLVSDELVWEPLSNLMTINETDLFFPLSDGTRFKLIDADINLSESFYLKASNPFMAYIRGAARHESFSAGASYAFKEEDTNDKIPPLPSWTMDCSGDVNGVVVDLPSEMEFASCLFPPILFADSTENYILKSDAINSGNILSINWSLQIKNPNLKAKAKIMFIDRAGNDTIVRIEYNPVIIAFEPERLEFGIVKSGEASTKTIRMKNLSVADAHIDDLMLKQISNGFDIIDSPAPFILPGLSAKDLTVRFVATEPGKYSDSLGVRDTCKSFFAVMTDGEVGYQEIDANDCDLGDVTADKPTERLVRLFNRGNLPLIIHGAKLPESTDITVQLPKVPTIADPITIPKKSYIDYRIRINATQMADYQDSVVFYSNTIVPADSICYIVAKSLMPGILSDNYEFGRKTKGFEYSTIDNGIKIENNGNVSITISDVILENDASDGVFKFDKSVVCKQIKPGEELFLAVKFMPKENKHYSLDLRYKLSDGTLSQSSTKLTGTGVSAQLKSSSDIVNLGVAIINNSADIRKATVIITNLSQTDWEFADRAVITNLEPINNSIGLGKDNFSSKGFALDNSNLSLPQELLPGQKLSFDVYFRAFTSEASASLRVLNDANQELVITFKGTGVEELLSVSSDPVATCYGTEARLELHISNFGTNDIAFDPPMFLNASPEFYFAESIGSFTVPKGSIYTIPINYRPNSRESLSSAVVQIEATNGSSAILTKEITGSAINLSRETTLQPIGTKVEIGSKTKKTIKLLNGEDISDLNIQNLHIRLSFLSNFLFVADDAVSLNKSLLGYFDLKNLTIDNKLGIIEADIVSISDRTINEGENLIDIEFDTYLSTIDTYKADINAEITTEDSDCVLFKSATGMIELQPYCASDISKILMNSNNLEAPKVSPNPISEEKFEINFSLGYDANITLEIIDINGKNILTVLEGAYKAGQYTQEVTTEHIPDGVYFIKLQSATIYLTEKIIIVR